VKGFNPKKRSLKILGLLFLISIGVIYLILPILEPEPEPVFIESFVLTDLNGDQSDLIEMHQSKFLIINFWATWCAPCRKEMPLLNNYHLTKSEDYPNVIGIAIDELDQVNNFVAELGIDFPILVGQSEAYDLMESLGNTILTLPYTILVNQEGMIVWSKNTEIKTEDLEQVLSLL